MENIELIISGVVTLYTVIIYLLPRRYASKIGILVDGIIWLGNKLEEAKNSKGGLTMERDGNVK
jgi:hypothetical protein